MSPKRPPLDSEVSLKQEVWAFVRTQSANGSKGVWVTPLLRGLEQ